MNPKIKCAATGFATVPVFCGVNAVCGDIQLLAAGLDVAFVLVGLRQAIGLMKETDVFVGEGYAIDSGGLKQYFAGCCAGLFASAAVTNMLSGDADNHEEKPTDVGSAYHEIYEPKVAQNYDPVQNVYYVHAEPA